MARTRSSSGRRDERGIAVVELALLLPILAVVLFGLVEFGLAFRSHEVLSQASREAVRYGVRPTEPKPSEGEIRQRAMDFLDSAGLSSDRSTVVVTGAGGESGEQLRVQVQYPASIAVFRLMKGSSPGTITLSSEGVLEHE